MAKSLKAALENMKFGDAILITRMPRDLVVTAARKISGETLKIQRTVSIADIKRSSGDLLDHEANKAFEYLELATEQKAENNG